MSLFRWAFVVEAYGIRLDMEQLAKALGITKPALYNQISAGTCAVKTYLDGGRRWADAKHVADHFEEMALLAA